MYILSTELCAVDGLLEVALQEKGIRQGGNLAPGQRTIIDTFLTLELVAGTGRPCDADSTKVSTVETLMNFPSSRDDWESVPRIAASGSSLRIEYWSGVLFCRRSQC